MAHLLQRRLLLAALLVVAVVLVLVAQMFMLAMAPAIALFAMVASRVMPGEELPAVTPSSSSPAVRAPAGPQCN
jgi:hypothetical protein